MVNCAVCLAEDKNRNAKPWRTICESTDQTFSDKYLGGALGLDLKADDKVCKKCASALASQTQLVTSVVRVATRGGGYSWGWPVYHLAPGLRIGFRCLQPRVGVFEA